MHDPSRTGCRPRRSTGPMFSATTPDGIDQWRQPSIVPGGSHTSLARPGFPRPDQGPTGRAPAWLDPSYTESRGGVCRYRCFSGYTLYATAGYDTHVGVGWSPPGLCAPASPRGPHPLQGSVCLGFPSPVSPLEAWRKTSGSADVAGLAPSPICRPVSPSRYALGADVQCCEPAAT